MTSLTSFISKVQHFDTMVHNYLVKKNVYLYESQQFETSKYISRCLHRPVFYRMSEQ